MLVSLVCKSSLVACLAVRRQSRLFVHRSISSIRFGDEGRGGRGRWGGVEGTEGGVGGGRTESAALFAH